MKKGCLGCLGCGCISVILVTVIICSFVWNWLNTTGRKGLAEGIYKVTEEGIKYAFEPETASEIASLTKEIRDDVASGKIGVIESYKYIVENVRNNAKLDGQVIFTVIYKNFKGKVFNKDEKPLLVDDEAAEAIRTIMYALSEGKLETNEAMNNIKPVLKNNHNNDEFFETSEVRKNITKEDMEKIAKSLKEYVKMNNLQAPPSNVTPDSLAKEEVIKFLQGLKKLKK